MNSPVAFLQAIARAVTALQLYEPSHPAARRALDQAFEALPDDADAMAFTFTRDMVSWGTLLIRQLRGWVWAGRLSGIGIHRLEFLPGVQRAELHEFIDDLARRLVGSPTGSPTEPAQWPHIRVAATAGADAYDPPSPDTSPVSLDREFALVEWVHAEVRAGRAVACLEAQVAVSALAVTMHREGRLILPSIDAIDAGGSQAATAHALNVSTLSMGLAEALGCGAREVAALGTAGLLHDIGKCRLPAEALAADTPSARAIAQAHTIEGARAILRADPDLDIAALVAYEHHLRPDGTGYPELRFPRDAHWASQLVAVCNAYERLRCTADRHHAPDEDLLALLATETGTGLDASMMHTFAQMLRQGTRVRAQTEALDADPHARRDARRA